MNRRLLWLAPYWPPSASIGARSPATLAACLARTGWEPVVVAPKDNLTDPPLDPAAIEPVAGIDVHWVPFLKRLRQRMPGEVRRWLDRVNPVHEAPDVSTLSTYICTY